MLGYGKYDNSRPIKKYDGVKAHKSLESLDDRGEGRLFNIHSA